MNRARLACCCNECDDGIWNGLLDSTSGWPHMPGDRITLVNNRPTLVPPTQTIDQCGNPADCIACGYSQLTGGDPLRIEYHWEADHWIWWPPYRALGHDRSFPACNDAGCGYWTGSTSGCGPNIYDEFQCAGGCTVAQEPAYRPGFWNPGYPCATEEELECCDIAEFSWPAECFTGGMTSYQRRVAAERFKAAYEVMMFNEGAASIDADATDSTGAVLHAAPTPMWRQYLATVHLEAHYQYQPGCVDLPPDLDVEENLSQIVPERFIAVRAGMPIFEFQIRAAAAEAIVTIEEAEAAIAVLRAHNDCTALETAWVGIVRPVLQAMREAGWLTTRDHRGEVAREVNELAAMYPAMAAAIPGGGPLAPEDLPVLGPYRLIPSYPYVSPEDVTGDAGDFQLPAWVLGVAEPDEGTEPEAHARWARLRSVFFRAFDGYWDFASWTWEFPQSPENNWEGGRQIGTNVTAWTKAGTSAGDLAWVVDGSPRSVDCFEGACEPTSLGCTLVSWCAAECGFPAQQLCDPTKGYASYGGNKYVFVGARAGYRVLEDDGPCECFGFNTSWAQRTVMHCDWDSSSVPMRNVPRADPTDQGMYPQEIAIPISSQYYCPGCVAANVDPPGIEAADLCPSHVCFDMASSPPSCETIILANPQSIAVNATDLICEYPSP